MEQIILASESKRRQDYLKLMGLNFICIAPDIDEKIDEALNKNKSNRAKIEEIAKRKVQKVLEMSKNENPLWLVGADTVISLDGKFYGKPSDREDAKKMMQAFQNRDHKVITGVALYNGRKKTINSLSVETTVSYGPMSEKDINWYLDSEDWVGVAGAYRIQGLASCFIKGISGSYSSIVGLPLREFYVMLKDNGYHFDS